MKTGEILNRLVGAAMIAVSIPFFINATVTHWSLPALFFGIGGLWLAARHDPAPPANPELQGRVDELAERLAATQLELTGTQRLVEELRQEREFMRELVEPSSPRLPPEVPHEPLAR